MVTIYENNTEDSEEANSNKEKKSNDLQDEHNQVRKTAEEIISDEELDVKVSKENGQGRLSDFSSEFIRKIPVEKEKATKIGEPMVQVNNALGRLATVYEKIRNAVEYKGEHVLKRSAIERILKRLAWEHESVNSKVDTEMMAEALIKELIWARYLDNKAVPLSKVEEVAEVLGKYFYIIENLNELPEGKSLAHSRSWIFSIASSELEDILDKRERELYVELMHDWFIHFFEWETEALTNEEKQKQIYLAVHRALVKSDDPIMRYHLLLKKFPNWREGLKKDADKFIDSFSEIYSSIESDINFSGRIGLYRKIQQHTAAFEVLKEMVERDPKQFTELLTDVHKFEKQIRIICKEKYQEIKDKVNTGIIRSILYIFATKVIFVLLLEVPYEIFKLGEVRYLPLTMNIMLPPILMWMIGLTISTPDDKNTQMIIDRLKTVVYTQKTVEKNAFSLHEVRGRSKLIRIFGYLYSLLFMVVFVGIGYLLYQIGFTIFGLIVFFIFLSLVLLFSFRIKYHANQMKVESEESGFIAHIFDYLTLPFLNLGFFLSKGLSKLNVFTIILDFLIEAPLKLIIDLAEEWTTFIKGKKEEVVEMPE